MTLKDVQIKNRINRNALGVGAILVILGSGLSIVPVYGWMLGASLGVIGLILSLPLQQTELAKTYGLTHTTDAVAMKDRVDMIHIKGKE
ncbi:MAG: hypothetical protein ACLPY5_03335 [Candidatus Bathyarchaeia archaeon]